MTDISIIRVASLPFQRRSVPIQMQEQAKYLVEWKKQPNMMVKIMTTYTTLGILGGGQLAQMLALSAIPLGIKCHIYEPSVAAAAALVAQHHRGNYDQKPLLKIFADAVDVISYEFENVPAPAANYLAGLRPVFPAPAALAVCQNRLSEKQFINAQGVATAPFAPVDATSSVANAIKTTGLPAILKTRTMGYDGKGQKSITGLTQAYQAVVDLAGVDLILEGLVPFQRELSILAVRDRSGAILRYPLVENHHHDGILRLSIAPAANVHPDVEAQADTIAERLLSALDYVGVLAIECFEVKTAQGPRLLVNELAPRVHNSGHWSIEGAITSQFENHVRAVCGLPLGPTTLRGMSAMINLIGAIPDISAIPSGVHVHLYHKEPRPERKVGHLTIVARDMATLHRKIEECRNLPGVWLPDPPEGTGAPKSRRSRD
jgi:5-(carboxyamino)imidazole ribonucleotide synthase